MESTNREHINIWLAYSDLFSGLLVITFGILLFQILPQKGPGDGSEEVEKRNAAQWSVTERLFEQIRSQGYEAEPKTAGEIKERFSGSTRTYQDLVHFNDQRGDEAVVIHRPEGEEQRITFGSQVLFDNEGIYRNTIKPEGIILLQSIGAIILSQGELYNEIRVIGHTDVKPPKGGDSFGYNWVLSSERAIAVVTELLTDSEIAKKLPPKIGQEYNRYKRGPMTMNFPPNRISAIGRGEFEPVGSGSSDDWGERQNRIYASWDDEKSMEQNRRIEIVLRSAPISQNLGPIKSNR